jgi:endonuclease/exonuclease/phosphatase family metal-dependent hydrolase
MKPAEVTEMLTRRSRSFAAVALFGLWLTSSTADAQESIQFKIMTFNILNGGNASNEIGSTSPLFGKPRYDDIAAVILQSGADVVAIQEDNGGAAILSRLQADDASWTRRGEIYSKFPLQPVSDDIQSTQVSRVIISPDQSLVVHNAHWWPGQGYGPFVAQSQLISTGSVTEDYVLSHSGVIGTANRNPADSLALVQPTLTNRESVFVLGDFNEPSHRDWTENYATNGGADRMTSNPTSTPLTLKVEWQGSKLLADAGFRDAYRKVFTNEIASPGNTWTPPYANGTPGRRNYDDDPTTGGQVLDRIDRIEYAGIGVKPIDAAVFGENPEAPEHAGKSELTPELVYAGSWPSDHRAVIATFEVPASSHPFGDLNFDGMINSQDWTEQFRPNHGRQFLGMHADDTYAMGDLDGDLDNDIHDFLQFRSVYDVANGKGSFQAMSAVPEPYSCSLLATGLLLYLLRR